MFDCKKRYQKERGVQRIINNRISIGTAFMPVEKWYEADEKNIIRKKIKHTDKMTKIK